MRLSPLKLLPVLALAGVILVWDFDFSKELRVSGTRQFASVDSILNPTVDMLAKIDEGVALLESSPPLKYENRAGALSRKQVALAILNKKTGEVFEKRIWVKEDQIKNYGKTGLMEIEYDNPDDGINVEVKWWNSFNTYYEVKDGDGSELAVVANKYLWLSSNLTSLPERSKDRYTDIIYAPYSHALHLPELIEEGKKYIDANVDAAFEELIALGVRSAGDANRLATDSATKDFLKNIILIEHIDPAGFDVADDGGLELSERVLVLIGANRTRSYRYTGSPAGASGLAQFIKPTYDAIVAKFPSAKLIKDYNLGMADHTNAAKAMVLFFDNYGEDVRNKITHRDIVSSIGITEEMLAAAYNGGPSRVASSINKYGMAWINSQLILPSSRTTLRSETINYVKKLRSIKELDIF